MFSTAPGVRSLPAALPTHQPLLSIVRRALALAVVGTLFLAAVLSGPRAAQAQDDEALLRAAMDTLPFVAYGTDARPDGTVIVMARGKECGVADVNGRGEWVLWVPVDAPCSPRPGDTLTFAMGGDVDGQEGVEARPTATWVPGGLPADLRRGVLFNRG